MFSFNNNRIVNRFMLYISDGRIDFAVFLEIMHVHSLEEKCQQEVMGAFKAHDPKGRGVISSQDLYRVLTQFGEKLPKAEGMNVYFLSSAPMVNTLYRYSSCHPSIRVWNKGHGCSIGQTHTWVFIKFSLII